MSAPSRRREPLQAVAAGKRKGAFGGRRWRFQYKFCYVQHFQPKLGAGRFQLKRLALAVYDGRMVPAAIMRAQLWVAVLGEPARNQDGHKAAVGNFAPAIWTLQAIPRQAEISAYGRIYGRKHNHFSDSVGAADVVRGVA